MKRLIILLPALILSGCSSSPTDVEPAELTFNQTDLNESQMSQAYHDLVDSAAASSEALRELSALANGKASLEMSREEYDEYIFQNSYVPAGMERIVDLKWTGDFYPVIEMLATLSGYTPAPSASRPLGRIDISIDTSKESRPLNVMDVIHRINNVHKDRIDIRVLEGLKIIQIDYL
ncbi:DotD/TraH family lipoprotein [Vibrio sp. D431a]|uniref:DotD/TraH family lipoprotein n=1 Tax=Vibrio sp. D431a TaxID=2837388 RepID=UPI002556AA3F|nr:hypothetical protein [Vibrio sp. D431a]MDK9793843.1 hypothetical protein [Vibrio sp. D431a]